MSDLVKLQRVASSRSLLYIDGDTTTQKNYGIYLKKAFQNMYQAYDGEQGLAFFQKHKPDVVILNLNLEKFDAVELISEIHDQNENVIMIAITEPCSNYDLLQTLDMGLNKTYLKPVGFAKLAHLLISLLPPPPPPKKPKRVVKPVEKKVEKKPVPKPKELSKRVITKTVDPVKPQTLNNELKKQQTQQKSDLLAKSVEKKIEVPKKELNKEPKKEIVKSPVKTDLEICFEFIKELHKKQTLVEFINSYKGVMVLHHGVIERVAQNSFFIKVNIAQALASKSEKQILIKTENNKYIHAQLTGIDLKTATLEFANPRILQYKQRDKEYARIVADKSFKAGIYYKKKHIDFDVSYISFKSAVLITKDFNIDIQPNSVIDITLGFDLRGPNAMIKDKKFTKVFAKCEVIRVDENIGHRAIIVLLQVSKAGERTLKKYLQDRESEIIYEFKSRIRR